MLCVMDFSLSLLNTFWGIYSVPKESTYAAVSLSINNETQYLSRFMTYAPSCILGKFSLEKTPLNLGL